MPNFDRRGFLQFLSVAGIAPLLPAPPVRAAAAAATAAASTSKALWAGIYANSGSVPNFVGAARSMGLSNAAIQGVSARSIGLRVALTATTEPMIRIAGSGKGKSTSSSQGEPLQALRKRLDDQKRVLSDEAIETGEAADQEGDTSDAFTPAEEPENT